MRYGSFLLILAVVAAGCNLPARHNLPPAQTMAVPTSRGPVVDGPGPGVIAYQPMAPAVASAVQIRFAGPDGMQINWDLQQHGAFDSEPLTCPGRCNFQEGAIFRLKLSNIPGWPTLELFPTLEVANSKPKTISFLAHNSIPVSFTNEDFKQVADSGNFVTKVIYLPEPEFQELALAGVDTLVSTRLDPGVDPIVEADRRGSIMAIIRLGNKDLQAAGANEAANAAAAVPGFPGPVAGLTAPQWGMPMTGTPIGLPGPPYIPYGSPAGLQRHTMVNHTRTHVPGPSDHIRVDVAQRPGMGYPAPATHARIVERARPGLGGGQAQSEEGVEAQQPQAVKGQPSPGPAE
jgi:hypothetical protein